jgi:hypothetical protein
MRKEQEIRDKLSTKVNEKLLQTFSPRSQARSAKQDGWFSSATRCLKLEEEKKQKDLSKMPRQGLFKPH